MKGKCNSITQIMHSVSIVKVHYQSQNIELLGLKTMLHNGKGDEHRVLPKATDSQVQQQ